LQPAVAGERRAKSVAICLVGEARVIGCKPVLDNIMKTMYTPIANEADVFVAMKVQSYDYGPARCLSGDPQTAVRKLLQTNFNPAAIEFRGDGPIIPECKKDPYSFECKPAFLVGVPCFDMVAKYEREHRGDKKYDYMMHLRGDLVYRASLPPFAEWPTLGSQLLFVDDCCGAPTDSHGRCPSEVHNARGDHGLGCIHDTWGVMSRGTADIYYQRNWNYERNSEIARQKTGLKCIFTNLYECLRGCVMHYSGIEVYRVFMNSKVLHSDTPSTFDQTVVGEVELRDAFGNPHGKRRKENTTQVMVPLTAKPEDIFNLEGM